MKKLLSLLLTGVLMASLLTGCNQKPAATSSSDAEAVSSEAMTQMPNPMKKVDSADVFTADLGLTLNAPKDAADVSYYIIDGATAQVDFSLNGASYCLRGDKTTADIAGVFEEFTDAVISLKDKEIEGTIKTTVSGGKLAAWSWDGVNYTLYTADKVEDQAIIDLTVSLADSTKPAK